MSETKELPALAWAIAANMNRFHAFKVADGRALCGKWAFLGKLTPLDAKALAFEGDAECAACRKKVNAKLASLKD